MPVITPSITLGDQVRLRRVAMGLSQRQLGEQIGGFTQQYVAYIEGSATAPTPDTQAALETALGVELNSPAMQLATSILLDRCRFNAEQELALVTLLGCCGE